MSGNALARLIFIHDQLVRDSREIPSFQETLIERLNPVRQWAKVHVRIDMASLVVVPIPVMLDSSF